MSSCFNEVVNANQKCQVFCKLKMSVIHGYKLKESQGVINVSDEILNCLRLFGLPLVNKYLNPIDRKKRRGCQVFEIFGLLRILKAPGDTKHLALQGEPI